jgi:hypothetical protein
MNGYRSHLLCRPVFFDDAKENQSRAQGYAHDPFLQTKFSGILLDFDFAEAGFNQSSSELSA